MKYLKYLKYLFRHKWFVFVECIKMKLYWQGIVHDLSKFNWDELKPYTDYFYGDRQKMNSDEFWQGQHKYGCFEASPFGHTHEEKFKIAWLKHQHRNPHHWQFWVGIMDSGNEFIIPMPEKYYKEMICDWIGAGKAITGKDNMGEWYNKNKQNIKLHPETQYFVEEYLKKNYFN